MALVSFSVVDSIALFLVLSVLFKSVLTYHCSLSLAAYSKLNGHSMPIDTMAKL